MNSILAVIFTTLFATKSATPANANEVWLAVSTKKNVMELRVGNRLIRRYDVSVGKKAHPTPHGTFRINHIVWNPSWVPPKEKWAKGKKPAAPGSEKNPMKVVKIFFKEPDYYLHGTGDEHLLGNPASHGCIRMSAADAYALAKLLQENGGAKKSSAWYQRAISGKQSLTVKLPKPIAIRIAP